MGIPKFFSWYIRQSNFTPTRSYDIPPNIDILSIDVNGLIHDHAQRVFKYGKYAEEPLMVLDRKTGKLIPAPSTGTSVISYHEYYTKIFSVYEGVYNEILNISYRLRPRRSLIIAIDGVAPQSKINQQRERRYKAAAERKPDQQFDSGAITPGTDFMVGFDIYLRDKLKSVSDDVKMGRGTPQEKALPPHIVYSGHLTPGEGEHKIADQLRNMTAINQNVAVYGADADLFMIYLMHLQQGWKNIYLIRVDNDRVEVVIDLRALETELKRMYPGTLAPSHDFVTLLYLNGNDFLPHFPVFERVYDALDALVGGYGEYLQRYPGKGITSGHEIIWDNMYQFLAYITEHYNYKLLKAWGENTDNIIKFPSLVVEKCITRRTVTSRTDTHCTVEFNVKQFPKVWYNYIFSPKTGDIIISPTSEDKKDMIHNYLEGIAWVYNYYRYGVDRVNKKWYYGYHYAPDFADLPRIMRRILDSGAGASWEANSIHRPDDFVSPLEQMVMVLSPRSLSIVPEELRVLYTEYSPIYDLLPEGFLIDNQGKMDDWQSVALLPVPNPYRVIQAVTSLNLPPEYRAKFQSQPNLILNTDLERGYQVRRGRGRGRPPGRGRSRGRGSRQ